MNVYADPRLLDVVGVMEVLPALSQDGADLLQTEYERGA